MQTSQQSPITVAQSADVRNAALRTMSGDIKAISEGLARPKPEIISAPTVVFKEDTGVLEPRRKKFPIRLLILGVVFVIVVLSAYFLLFPWLKTFFSPEVIAG